MELLEYKSLIEKYESRIYTNTYGPILDPNDILYLCILVKTDLCLKYLIYLIAYEELININSKYLIYIDNVYNRECLRYINCLLYRCNIIKYVQYNFKVFRKFDSTILVYNYSNIFYKIQISDYGCLNKWATVIMYFDSLGRVIDLTFNRKFTKDNILVLLDYAEHFPKGFYKYYIEELGMMN
jgi:hypothetical protein